MYILRDVDRRRLELLAVRTPPHTHEPIRVFVSGRRTGPGCVLEDAHILVPIILLIVGVFVKVAELHRMALDHLGQVLRKAGTGLHRDHIGAKVGPNGPEGWHAVAPTGQGWNRWIVEYSGQWVSQILPQHSFWIFG